MLSRLQMASEMTGEKGAEELIVATMKQMSDLTLLVNESVQVAPPGSSPLVDAIRDSVSSAENTITG